MPCFIRRDKQRRSGSAEGQININEEDADALIEACREAGVLCSSKEGGVRYHPATTKAKELIQLSTSRVRGDQAEYSYLARWSSDEQEHI